MHSGFYQLELRSQACHSDTELGVQLFAKLLLRPAT